MKLLICILTFCLGLATSLEAAPEDNISSFNLSSINNQNISDDVRYFSLKGNITSPPDKLDQLYTWLSTLEPHQTTSALGDKYVVAFEIYNDTPINEWFVYPHGSVVQNIQILSFSSDKPANSFETGHGLNNQHYFHYGSKIEILPGQHKTLLMLFSSEFFFAPINILIKPEEQAQQIFQLENVVLLISLGVCFGLAIYSLFLFFSTRNKQYLSYALVTLAFTLGWANFFGVTQSIGMGILDFWLIPTFLIGIFFFCYFNIQFLRLDEFAPKTALALKVVAWIIIVTLPFAFYSQGIGPYLVTVLASVILLIGIYTGIRCWIDGYSPAKYFVFALLSVSTLTTVGTLMNFNIILDLNINIYLFGLIGSSLGSLLLAFALAAKVRLLTIKNIELTSTLENTVTKRTSELRLANSQLAQTNNNLVEVSNAKGTFLATMSHEIRTPLTSIIGYADAILLGDIDKSEQKRVTRIIADNGNHLLSVINDILDISKIEANKLDFESIPTSLFSVLAQIESVVTKQASDKGLAFHLDYEYPLPAQINTDPTRLKQILFNLTSNAINFTEHGYIGLSVSLVANQLQIKIKDSGQGISVQQQQQLFQPFTQADSSINRQFGGTGLGLSISRRLAIGLGGNIIVNSALKKGSTFTLNIALSVVQNSTWVNSINDISQLITNTSVKAAALPNFMGSKVLLAEDHPDNRELISIFLKRMNIAVTETENGLQVLDKMLYQKFDLILLDIYMPAMDGTETLNQIRISGDNTPVIALTANNMKHQIENYIRLGFTDYLAKPIERSHFISKLSLFLNKQGDIDNPLYQGDMLLLIKDYQQNLRKQVVNLQQALEKHVMNIIGEISHGIRGSAASFGFNFIGQKFASIECSTLRNDEAVVSHKLPKLLALTKQCIDLPGIDIPQAIVKHHNCVEQFLRSVFELVKDSHQTIQKLTTALDNNEVNNALVHLYKFFPACTDCALIRSEPAFKTLEYIIKQGKPERHQYSPQLDIIRNHLAELNEVLQPSLLDET